MKWINQLSLAAIFLTACVYGDPFFFSPAMIGKHLESYSDEEKADIEKDLAVVRSVCFSKAEQQKQSSPVYLATAGGPGARKSTILERFIQAHPEYSNAVYLDPNQRGLKFMAHTYHAQSLNALKAASNLFYLPIAEAAYEKWRAASNYITYALLEEALQQRADIAHGTTLTGAYVPDLLDKLKSEGYQITLLLCFCDDPVRTAAVEYRNQEQRFFQSSSEEAAVKGKLFPEKLNVYFAKADTLYLYWSEDVFSEELLGAVFDKGQVTVNHDCAFEFFRDKYEEDRAVLQAEGKNVPSWDELLDIYQARFK